MNLQDRINLYKELMERAKVATTHEQVLAFVQEQQEAADIIQIDAMIGELCDLLIIMGEAIEVGERCIESDRGYGTAHVTLRKARIAYQAALTKTESK